MPAEVEVRGYRSSDRSAILDLAGRFTEFELPPWRLKHEIDEANRKALAAALDSEIAGSVVLVAECDDEFAGFIHLQSKTDYFTKVSVGYIADIAVHPDHERRGVAGSLLEAGQAWARGKGMKTITLHVFEGNDRAARLYEKHGFARDVPVHKEHRLVGHATSLGSAVRARSAATRIFRMEWTPLPPRCSPRRESSVTAHGVASDTVLDAPHGARRWLAILGWVVLGLVLAVYIGLPVAMGVAAVWPTRAGVGEPPAGFEAVSFQRADGVKLAAWYAPSRNGAAIVVAHGAGGSREGVRRQAEMLAKRGYGVLALDMSGHGESGGRTNRLAWQGTEDIAAAARYLAEKPGVRAIGAFGSSMGGEAVLGASAAVPQLKAIVADGATRRSTAELTTLPVQEFARRELRPARDVRDRAGAPWQRPPAPLLEEMRRATATRYLLIAAGGNPLETEFNRYFAEQIGPRVQLWVAPGVGHVGALEPLSRGVRAARGRVLRRDAAASLAHSARRRAVSCPPARPPAALAASSRAPRTPGCAPSPRRCRTP